MPTITYEIKQDGKIAQQNIGPDWAIAITRQPVRIVCEHFAIRRVFVPHPYGELFMDVYLLDHIHTGYRAHGSHTMFGDCASESECEAIAKSLATIPIDWRASKGSDIERYMENLGERRHAFFAEMRKVAHEGKSIDWNDQK